MIVNGDETANATVYVNVDESPLTDDLEFIRALYQGLYYREPLGFELGEFYNRLKAGELTREQLIEELRDRGEFVKARDILLSHKSFDGEWDTIANALDKVETNPYSSSASLDRPDDPGTPGAGNFVSMNEVVSARIEVPNDIDYFRIQSLGSGRNGLLTITLLAGHPGASISELSKPLYARGPSGFVTFGTIAPWDPSGEGYSRSGTSTVSYDLRNFEGGEDWYFEFYIKGNAIETGSYTLVLSNEFALENEQDGANFDSPVNNFAIAGSLGYLTQQFAYTDQYGAIGSHNPEAFFTRLFRNKYEQNPSPIQIARGVELLKESGTSQTEFLESFALDNMVLSAGSYNYTSNLSIPNVPLDVAAFGETALVYSALVGQAPSQAQVARLTLTPEFEIRALSERARLIMEMPAFAARYGLAMPEVDFVGVSNGERFETGSEHRVRVEALSLGADDLAGTLDDGRIHKVDLFLNGQLHDTLSYGERNTTGVGEYYDFNLSDDLSSGEYWMEVVAEDINGLQSRAELDCTAQKCG